MAITYGSGNSTATVDWCNTFCYVFSENAIKVTLGTDFSTTQKVTLTFGGYSIERNCINRVCTFDLSGLFQSLFSMLRFSHTYATQDDPFLKSGDIVLTITGISAEMKKTTSVRFAAYQIGQTTPYKDRVLPFYSGLDLMGCQLAEGDTVFTFSNGGVDQHVDAYDNVAKLFKIEPTDAHTYDKIVVQYKSSNGTLLETITYILDTCPPDYYLHWFDDMGRPWYIGLDKSEDTDIQSDIKSGQRIKLHGIGNRPVKKDNQRAFNAGKVAISKDMYYHLTTLAASPFVWLWLNNQWIVVEIKDATFVPKQDELSDFSCDIVLPENYVIQL